MGYNRKEFKVTRLLLLWGSEAQCKANYRNMSKAGKRQLLRRRKENK